MFEKGKRENKIYHLLLTKDGIFFSLLRNPAQSTYTGLSVLLVRTALLLLLPPTFSINNYLLLSQPTVVCYRIRPTGAQHFAAQNNVF
jgi:hypothetical protein